LALLLGLTALLLLALTLLFGLAPLALLALTLLFGLAALAKLALALLLGLVGIYGTVSYAVSERRREIGIRLALGARSGQVRRMFVRRALVVVGIGVAIGLGAASGLTRLMASQLFGVSPLDPATHAVVASLLVVAAAAASYLSACRATSLDPAGVLKAQ
jgi:ABC-type antimicrobial peptide transport system permease subunit